MSAIIKFPLEKVQRTSTNNMTNGETAKILVFEGVQYVKSEPAKQSPRAAKRATPASKGKK